MSDRRARGSGRDAAPPGEEVAGEAGGKESSSDPVGAHVRCSEAAWRGVDRSAVPEWLTGFLAETSTMSVPPPLRPPAKGARPAAVLILFGEGRLGPDLLLIQRAATLNNHAGQPAFPGGGVDPQDAGPVAAALREAAEETGLDPAGVEVLAVLPEMYIWLSRYRVTPVVAWWREPSEVSVQDPGEVAAVARVPIADLTDPANRLRIRHSSGHIGPAFRVRGMLVWGFTAGLLDRLLALGGWERPWDTGRVEELPSGSSSRR